MLKQVPWLFIVFICTVSQHLAPCCLFLAAKIEEQPRKLEHVLKVAHACLHRDAPPLDLKSEVQADYIRFIYIIVLSLKD